MGSSNSKLKKVSLKKQKVNVLHNQDKEELRLDVDLTPPETIRNHVEVRDREEAKVQNPIQRTKIDINKAKRIIKRERIRTHEDFSFQRTLDKKHSRAGLSQIPHETFSEDGIVENQRLLNQIKFRKFKLINKNVHTMKLNINKSLKQKIQPFKSVNKVESFAGMMTKNYKFMRDEGEKPKAQAIKFHLK